MRSEGGTNERAARCTNQPGFFRTDAPGRQRSQVEIEADIFAAEFLMPANQLRNIFSMTFGTEEFQVNRDSAFALGLKKLSALKDRLSTARDLSSHLASVDMYAGEAKRSLSSISGVSPDAMAIRIEELKLIANW